MGLFNDPVGIFAAAFDWSAIDHYHAAVDALQVVSGEDWRNRVGASLHAVYVEYRLFQQSHPRGPDITDALRNIAAACAEIDKNLETLLAARVSAPSNMPDRAAVLTTLYASVSEIVTPANRGFLWDEREPGQAPHRGEYKRMGRRINELSEQLKTDSLERSTRPVDPAFDRLIGRLAVIFEEVTELDAYAEHKGDQPGYRSPFARFVAAFWPAISSAAPSNQRIAGALKRRDALGPDYWANKRTDLPDHLCSSSDSIEEEPRER